jgi:hypothetical protein
VTLAGNIVLVVTYLVPSVSPVIRALVSLPNLALDNSMATRVHRMLRSSAGSTSHTSPIPLAPRTYTLNHSTAGGFRSQTNTGIEVNVMTAVHADDSVKHPEYDV